MLHLIYLILDIVYLKKFHFHSESNCHYHFIIKELTEEFEGGFGCLGENTEKCITFSIRMKKELKTTDERGKKLIQKIISNRLKIIDNVRFVVSPLSNLANISLREFIKLSANMEMIIKKM